MKLTRILLIGLIAGPSLKFLLTLYCVRFSQQSSINLKRSIKLNASPGWYLLHSNKWRYFNHFIQGQHFSRERKIVCPKLRVSPLNAQTKYWVFRRSPYSISIILGMDRFYYLFLISNLSVFHPSRWSPPSFSLCNSDQSSGWWFASIILWVRYFTCTNRFHLEDWCIRYSSSSHLTLRWPYSDQGAKPSVSFPKSVTQLTSPFPQPSHLEIWSCRTFSILLIITINFGQVCCTISFIRDYPVVTTPQRETGDICLLAFLNTT